MINLRRTKNLSSITREWDAIAALREQQISTGRDHSANLVLAPAILAALGEVDHLVDIGCGTGWLTARAAVHARIVVGIDPSEESISIARKNHSGVSVSFEAESVEQYARRRNRPRFDAAISNMAASSAPDLEGFLSSSRLLLRRKALFIATIPHPCFWSLYWGYATHPKFRYDKSVAVEGEFKIRKQSSHMLTTHFHHPLSRYMTALASAGFSVLHVRELFGRGFKLPRFMLVSSRAV